MEGRSNGSNFDLSSETGTPPVISGACIDLDADLSGRILCVNPGGTAEVFITPLSQRIFGTRAFFHALSRKTKLEGVHEHD